MALADRRALLDPWILRGRVVTLGFEGRATLVGGVVVGAKPWRGRALEGSGGGSARVVTFSLEGRKAVAGAYSRELWR